VDGDGDQKQRNREILGRRRRKIGGETDARIVSVALSTMRGEYSTTGLGVCGSIFYQSLAMYLIIRSI
jgi:hypothetical protein